MKWFRGQSQMAGPPAATNSAVGSGNGTAASGHVSGHTQGGANDMNGRTSATTGQPTGDFRFANAQPSYQPYPAAAGSTHIGYAPNTPHGNPHGVSLEKLKLERGASQLLIISLD